MFVTFVTEDHGPKRFPWMNTALIILNAVVCYQTVNRPDFQHLLDVFVFVPSKPLGPGLLTSLFLHSSWTQLVANMTFLFMFGQGVEKRVGMRNYLLCYLFCGLAGELAHWFFHSRGLLPLIGASRTVTGLGVMYFLLYPWGKMKWIFSFFGVPLVEIPSRTLFGFGLWGAVQVALAFFPWSKISFIISALSKLGGSVFTITQTAGTAWEAHLGAAGMGFFLYLVSLQKKGRS